MINILKIVEKLVKVSTVVLWLGEFYFFLSLATVLGNLICVLNF